MSQQNLSQVRVVDPLLTEIARGYGSPNARIADVLFPIVGVRARAGKIISFGPDAFRIVNTARAPGANTKRIQLGYASGDFSLTDHRLEGSVPIEHEEEADEVPGIDLGEHAVNTVQDVMANEREKQAADLARNEANYPAANKDTLTGDDLWGDPDSDPFAQVNAAKEVIRKKIGRRPNVLVPSPSALNKLRNHPKVLDRLSITADRPPATIEQLQRLFEIDRIVEGESNYADGPDAAPDFHDMWGDDAVLAYVTPASMQQRGSPNYGYTYRLRDRPIVEEPYFEKNPQTWFYPVSDAYRVYLVGATAGFLFKDAGK